MTFNEIRDYLENKGLSFNPKWNEFRFGDVVFCDCKHDFNPYAKEKFYALEFTRLTLGHDSKNKLLTELFWEIRPELRYKFTEITPEFLDKKYQEFLDKLDWLAQYGRKQKEIKLQNDLRKDF